MLKPLSLFLSLALAAAVLISGCGSSGSSATATSWNAAASSENEAPAKTKAEFMKRAEEICVQAKESRFNEAVKYRKEHEKELEALKPIPAENKILRAVTLPSIAKQAEEMEAIGIPPGQEKKLGAIFAAIKQGLNGAQEYPYAIEMDIPSQNPFLKAARLIAFYGFQNCRNVP